MAVEVDVKKSDIPMSPVKKGHTTVWHLQKMKDEGKKITMVGTAYLDPVFTMMCEKAGVDLVRYTAPGENSEMRAQNIHWWTRMQKKMAPNICLNAVMQTQQYADKTVAVQEAARLLADGADCVMPMGVTNEVLKAMADKLSAGELIAMREAYEKKAAERYPLRTQLEYGEKQELKNEDQAFLV